MEDQIYLHHAEMCKVLSHPKRLELINILRDKEMNVGELSQRLGLAIGNLSQHLAYLYHVAAGGIELANDLAVSNSR